MSQSYDHDTIEHFIALTLAVLGVVQGLAFNNLAERLPRRNEDYTRLEQALHYVVYVVCALILIRVFQTYALAAVEQASIFRLKFTDLVAVFAVGLLQYWIFDCIDKYTFVFRQIMVRIGILAVAAVGLYIRAAYELYTIGPAKNVDYVNELVNISLSLVVALLSFIGFFTASRNNTFFSTDKRENLFRLILSALIAADLAANIFYSMRDAHNPLDNQALLETAIC